MSVPRAVRRQQDREKAKNEKHPARKGENDGKFSTAELEELENEIGGDVVDSPIASSEEFVAYLRLWNSEQDQRAMARAQYTLVHGLPGNKETKTHVDAYGQAKRSQGVLEDQMVRLLRVLVEDGEKVEEYLRQRFMTTVPQGVIFTAVTEGLRDVLLKKLAAPVERQSDDDDDAVQPPP